MGRSPRFTAPARGTALVVMVRCQEVDRLAVCSTIAGDHHARDTGSREPRTKPADSGRDRALPAPADHAWALSRQGASQTSRASIVACGNAPPSTSRTSSRIIPPSGHDRLVRVSATSMRPLVRVAESTRPRSTMLTPSSGSTTRRSLSHTSASRRGMAVVTLRSPERCVRSRRLLPASLWRRKLGRIAVRLACPEPFPSPRQRLVTEVQQVYGAAGDLLDRRFQRVRADATFSNGFLHARPGHELIATAQGPDSAAAAS